MPSKVTTLDWTVLAAYAVVLVCISLYHSRKLKTQDDVLLAGRSMSRWPIALSMYMALFSTNTFVGVTGWLNRPNGTVWIGLQNIGIMLAVPFVVWLYPSLFFRLRISTAYEYLEKRFSYSVRVFAAVFFLASRIMWMATMLYSSGLVISMMLGWTGQSGGSDGQVLAIVLVAALGTSFALAGGMHAVIWTDVVQFFIMMGGVVAMAIYAVVRSGGLGQVLHDAAAAGKFSPPPLFSLTDDLSIASGLLLGFIAMLSSAGADQVVLQTYLTAKSEKEAKKSLWRNGLLLKPMSLIFPALGLLMFVYYQRHPQIAAMMRVPDDALSVFVVNVLPTGMRGLMVVAILSAVVDSIASGMAASSAVVQVDFIRRLRRDLLSDRSAVRLARVLILLWGILITLAGLWVRELGKDNSVIQILNVIMYPFAGVLLGVFLLGLLTTRASATGTLVGAAVGFLVTVAVPLSKTALGLISDSGVTVLPQIKAHVLHLSRVSPFYFGALGALATVVIGYVASLPTRRPAADQLEGLTKYSPAGAAATEGGSTSDRL